MKWIALICACSAVIPFAGWLRRRPGELPKVWMLVGFLPFGIGAFHLDMATISWPNWSGYVYGLEISALDLVVISLWLSLPGRSPPVPFRWSFVLYLVAILVSAFQAMEPWATAFYGWQVARMFLVYIVVAKGCAADKRVAPAVLTGMAIGIGFQACFALMQRYVFGSLQPSGSFGAQNSLGLVNHFVVFPWAALLLAGQRGVRPLGTLFAGIIVAVLTISRATIGLEAVGYAVLYVMSVMRQWSQRKSIVLFAGVFTLILIAPLVLASFEKRFGGHLEPQGEYDERAAFQKAAEMIIADYPFGVGANHYVIVAVTQFYDKKAGVVPLSGSLGTNVHNVYLLVTAETGYFGLITFLTMLLQPLIVTFRCARRNPKDVRGDVLLGLGVSLLIIYVHSYFEWIFITVGPQYMFAIDVGLIAGLATQLGYWRSPAAADVSTVGTIAAVRGIDSSVSQRSS